MAIEFRCNECQQLLRVPDDSAGKNARCPKCQALMAVPAAAAEAFGSASSPVPQVPTPPQTPPPPPALLPGSFGGLPEFGSQPAAPAKPANPFGDAGGAFDPANPFAPAAEKPSLNPYATPGGGYAQAPSAAWNGPRSGLPWETMPQSLGVWWKTAGVVMGSPSLAFSQMRQFGGLGQPIKFNVFALSQLMAVGFFFFVLFALAIMASGGGGDAGEKALGLAMMLVMYLVFGAIYVLLGSTLGMMFSAAIYHVMLMIVGGGNRGYETTFRVTSYATCSLMWLFAIPYLGAMIGGIWLIVLMIIGLSKAHEISAGKTAFAVLLPPLVCCGGYVVLVVLVLALTQQ